DWVRFIASARPSTWTTKEIAGRNQMDLTFSSVKNDIIMMLVLGIIYTLIGVFIGMLSDGELGRITHALRRLFRRKKRAR
ncbi:ABC transporter permease, partial [Morganella morganii]|nr:ABC transporter permease [Morganella morganii]